MTVPTRFLSVLLIGCSLAVGLAGCDSGGSADNFDVTVRVVDAAGDPVSGVDVRVRPCYTGEACSFDAVVQGATRSVNGRSGRGQRAGWKAVELAAFDAVVQADQTAIVEWTTASETNNAGFRVEARGPGEDAFRLLHFVDGAGTTGDSMQYRYRTEPLPTGTSQIRIVAVDTEGERTPFDPVAVFVPELEPQVVGPYPNPLADRTTIGIRAADPSDLAITVHRLDGTRVETVVERTVAPGATQLAWEADAVPDGIYELRSSLRVEGEAVAQDTAITAVLRSPQQAARIGRTDGDGRVSTRDRGLFPAVIARPEIQIRDANGTVLGRTQLSSTVQFVVASGEEDSTSTPKTFLRTIAEGKNKVTLTLQP